MFGFSKKKSWNTWDYIKQTKNVGSSCLSSICISTLHFFARPRCFQSDSVVTGVERSESKPWDMLAKPSDQNRRAAGPGVFGVLPWQKKRDFLKQP